MWLIDAASIYHPDNAADLITSFTSLLGVAAPFVVEVRILKVATGNLTSL